MFNVGGPEFLVIILVALVVLGPQQLPKAMRTFGSVMAEVRKVSNSFQAEVRSAMDTAVDTSGSEKPKSATMAPARPAAAAPERDDSGDPAEVVARNEASPDVDRVEPAIDPADRAAG